MPAPAELLGKPLHIAGVYDNADLTVFLNGQPSAKAPPVKTADETLTAYIGALRRLAAGLPALRGFFRYGYIRVSKSLGIRKRLRRSESWSRMPIRSRFIGLTKERAMS